MNEVNKSIESAKRVENAKNYLANLKAKIEEKEARYDLMPKNMHNSNLVNPERTSVYHELNRLKKEYRDNQSVVHTATVDDNDVKNILDNIDI